MNRLLVLIHIALLLISCSRSDDRTLDHIRFNASNNITSLDPAFASNQDNIWAVTQIFNGLVQLDTALNPVPCIASSWSVSDSGTRFTFILRKDVYFHSDPCFSTETRRVVADDFVYSFNRLTDSKTASPGAWIFNDKIAPNGIRALGTDTLEILLIRPFAPFISLLTMPYCHVVPKEAIDQYGKEFARHPVGTGPYRFVHWEEDVKLILNRNENYFERINNERLPFNPGLSISFISNNQMALLSFLKGHLDFYNGIHSSIKDALLTRDGQLKDAFKEHIELSKVPVLNTEYLAISLATSSADQPLGNPYFRKALNHAINREKMIRYLRNNVGTAAEGGFIPISLPGHLPLAGVYDIDLARRYLDSSGIQNARIVLSTTKDYLDLSVFIQQEFDRIGVDCEIDVLPSAALKEAKLHNKLSFFRASWIADYPDAENYLSCFYSANFAPNGPNYTHYNSEDFDELYEESLRTENESDRIGLYREMDSLLMQQSPVIVLYYDQSMRLNSRRISGLPQNALNIPWFKYARIRSMH